MVERVMELQILPSIFSISSILTFSNLSILSLRYLIASLKTSVSLASIKELIKPSTFFDLIPSRLYPTDILRTKSFSSDKPNSLARTLIASSAFMYSLAASSILSSVDHSQL